MTEEPIEPANPEPAIPEPAIPTLLLNGDVPALPADVEKRFAVLGYPCQTISHAPMRTVEDSRKYRNGVPGGYSKNLFLRNKKGKMWLVTLLEDRQVDLKQLGQQIGAGRVSFASPQRLMHYLGVIPGAVTPLAAINDHSNSVSVVLDATLLERDPLHFHPCDNSMTTTINKEGLLGYLNDCQHEPVVLDFDALDS